MYVVLRHFRCVKWSMPTMFGVGKKSLLEPEEETFVIDIEEEDEGYDGDRIKRAADGGDFWATR